MRLREIALILICFVGCKEPDTSNDPSNVGNPNWSFLDNGGFTSNIEAYNPVPIEFNSKMYVFWHEGLNGGNAKIKFGIYSSNNWTTLSDSNGMNKNSSANADYIKPVVHNSKLYASWHENNYHQVRVAVYNGNDSSPSWSFVDGDALNTGLNYNTSKEADRTSSTLISFNSKLYLFWAELNNSNKVQLRVKVYNDNDSSPSWSSIDGGGINGLNFNNSKNAYAPAVTVFNSKLYLAWPEDGASDKVIRVAVYNGNDSSPSWSFIDGNHAGGLNIDSTMRATGPKLIVFNNKLYIGWSENALGSAGSNVTQGKIKVYNGDDSSPFWTNVHGSNYGLNVHTDFSEEIWNLAVHNSQLHVSLSSRDGAANVVRIYVKVYNSDDSSPSWNALDGDSTAINCANTTGDGQGAYLFSFGGYLFATSSQKCSSLSTFRLQVHD